MTTWTEWGLWGLLAPQTASNTAEK